MARQLGGDRLKWDATGSRLVDTRWVPHWVVGTQLGASLGTVQAYMSTPAGTAVILLYQDYSKTTEAKPEVSATFMDA